MPRRRARPTSTIRTKSIYAPVGDDDGLRVLVTRFHPRGVKRERYDVWYRDLAPSRNLLRRYKEGAVLWDEFLDMLRSELRQNRDSRRLIRDLNTKSWTQNITILCYEKSGIPCHRHMIKRMVEKPGMRSYTWDGDLD